MQHRAYAGALADAHTHAYSDTNADAGADRYAYSDTNTGADPNSYIHTWTYGYAQAYCYAPSVQRGH